MNCKKCGAPLMENDQFCKSCGAAVNEVNGQNNIGNNSQQPVNNYANNNQPVNNYANGYNSQPVNNSANGYNGQPVNNYANGYNSQPANNYAGGYASQPVNNYGSGYNAQPMYNIPTKSGNNNLIIIGIIAFVAVVVIGVILYFIFNKDGASVLSSNSSYSVKFDGYTLSIPTNITSEVSGSTMYLSDKNESWYAEIVVQDMSYSEIVNMKEDFQQTFLRLGYTASAGTEKKIGGVNFLTFEISRGGTRSIMSMTKASSTQIFLIVLATNANEYDYNVLKTLAPIFSGANYTGVSNSMNGFGFNAIQGVFSELAQ